jgi:hypothetical protein
MHIALILMKAICGSMGATVLSCLVFFCFTAAASCTVFSCKIFISAPCTPSGCPTLLQFVPTSEKDHWSEIVLTICKYHLLRLHALAFPVLFFRFFGKTTPHAVGKIKRTSYLVPVIIQIRSDQ